MIFPIIAFFILFLLSSMSVYTKEVVDRCIMGYGPVRVKYTFDESKNRLKRYECNDVDCNDCVLVMDRHVSVGLREENYEPIFPIDNNPFFLRNFRIQKYGKPKSLGDGEIVTVSFFDETSCTNKDYSKVNWMIYSGKDAQVLSGECRFGADGSWTGWMKCSCVSNLVQCELFEDDQCQTKSTHELSDCSRLSHHAQLCGNINSFQESGKGLMLDSDVDGYVSEWYSNEWPDDNDSGEGMCSFTSISDSELKVYDCDHDCKIETCESSSQKYEVKKYVPINDITSLFWGMMAISIRSGGEIYAFDTKPTSFKIGNGNDIMIQGFDDENGAFYVYDVYQFRYCSNGQKYECDDIGNVMVVYYEDEACEGDIIWTKRGEEFGEEFITSDYNCGTFNDHSVIWRTIVIILVAISFSLFWCLFCCVFCCCCCVFLGFECCSLSCNVLRKGKEMNINLHDEEEKIPILSKEAQGDDEETQDPLDG